MLRGGIATGDSTFHDDYNPTACLAGFIVRFADKGSQLFQLGSLIARDAVVQLLKAESIHDMHTTLCYIRLMQYLEEADATSLVDYPAFKRKLMDVVRQLITQDTSIWEESYICRPSQFFQTNDSIFYDDNRMLADYECSFIIKTQRNDGSWEIPWCWSDYPEQWAISKNWWKSNGIIQNLLYLRGLGKL